MKYSQILFKGQKTVIKAYTLIIIEEGNDLASVDILTEDFIFELEKSIYAQLSNKIPAHPERQNLGW